VLSSKSFKTSAAGPSNARVKYCTRSVVVTQPLTRSTRLYCSRKVFQGAEPLYGRTGCNCLTTTVGATGTVPTAAAGMTVGGIVAAELVVVTVVAPALVAELKMVPETPTVVATLGAATVVPEVVTGPTLAAESETITVGLTLAAKPGIATGVPTLATGPEVTNAEPTLATELETIAGPSLATKVGFLHQSQGGN